VVLGFTWFFTDVATESGSGWWSERVRARCARFTDEQVRAEGGRPRAPRR